jgi:hypothetical protein
MRRPPGRRIVLPSIVFIPDRPNGLEGSWVVTALLIALMHNQVA